MDNYELIRMLIEGDTLTFRDRLQSFIEQLPDNKRSVNKEGFFPLFVLGGFLALPDAELGESLGVKQVFFRVEKYKKNNKSYVNGVKFAILIKEQNKKDKLLFIVVYEKNPIVFDRKEVEYIKSKLNSHDTEETWHSIQIKHEDKVGIVVYDKCDDDLFPDKSASHKGELFVLKKRTEEKNLEELISKCFLLDVDKVSSGIKGVFDYFDSLVQDYIIEESGNFDHESDYHGLLSGFFVMLFKYRYNLKLYPELSLGEGYSDIVVLVRSQERLNNVIPIIVELKAGKGLAIQGDPFEQAKKYAEAFKYGPRRMLTNNNNVIYAVLNFDLPRDRIEIGTTARDNQHLSPFLQLLLESGDKDIIYEQLKYLYYTIPNLSDNYYMYTSKMLLGELMPAKAEKGIWNKYIFQHDKSVSNDITSFGFLNSGKDQLVLLNVIRSDSRNKKINIDEIIEKDEEANIKLNMDESIQSSRNLKIKEVNLLLKTKKANIGEFKNWCRKVQVNSYSNLDDYNEKKTQSFDGKCVKLDVDVNKLNGLLNKVVNKKVDGAQSHNAEHHIELLKKISEILFPFKELIDSEVDFQAMLHGLLMYHQESTSSKKLVGVISEVQTGGGKRIDIGVVGGEIFTGIELKFDKTKGIVPEGEELTAKAKEAESQLERYKKQPNNIKSLIDSEEARLFWAVFHRGANEPKLLIETRSEFYAFQLEHSSICLPSVSRRSFAVQKQKEDYFLLVKESCLHDIENLLSKNVSVEIKDKHGRTPSHYAAKCARLDIVNLFYQKGANFKAEDKNGETPLDFVNLFLKGSGKDISNKNWLKSWKPLHYAAYNNNVGIVQKIFELLFNESNKDINVRDGKYGYAPLNVAVYYNRTGMVELFLNKSANIETEDIYGRTPLHHAVRYSTLNMTRLLYEKGANIKAKNQKGEIPLCIADQYGKVDIIDFLLNKGATIEASDFNDNTALKLAYCIKGVMDKTNNNVTPDFEKLKNKLPKSVKNVVFASELCIRNVGYKNRYLYAADFEGNPSLRRTKDDTQRQPVFLWAPVGKSTERGIQQSLWKFEPNGDNVYIVNVGYNGRYLYAADFEGNPSLRRTKDDTQRQPVFLWAPGGKPTERGIQQSLWKFEPNGDNVYIVNVGYNGRYLYAADFEGNPSLRRTKDDTQRQPVFLWAPGGKPTERGIQQGLWRVEDCSSTRKKRDTQKLASKANIVKDKNFVGVKDLTVNQVEYYHNRSLHQYSNVKLSNQSRVTVSSGTRLSSWINDLFGWVKSSVGGLFYSRAALPEETSSTTSSILQVDALTDVNGTIMLLDVLVRKVTGQKYISTVDQPISPLEAQGYALNIIEKFEKVLNETAIKSGISVTNINFDPVAVQSAIVGQIISEKFSEISKTLYSFAKEACPEFQQTDKFLVHLRSQLEVEKETTLLQQKVEKPSKIFDQQVSRKVELPKKPDTFLNGTSVVKGISNVLEL